MERRMRQWDSEQRKESMRRARKDADANIFQKSYVPPDLEIVGKVPE